jgi:diguanylate cyclase (GGDEF)-like protein/PAS domain S-box-containing protein
MNLLLLFGAAFIGLVAGIWWAGAHRRQAGATHNDSEARFKRLFDDNPHMYFIVDAGGRIIAVNRFGAEQPGYEPEELVGQPLTLLLPHEDQAIPREQFERMKAAPGFVQRREMDCLHRDGNRIHMRVSSRLSQNARGEQEILLVCDDVRETRQLTARLNFEATHDALTGLLNRWAFQRCLDTALERSRATGAEHVFCYFDIDQFNVVNESCGHAGGDLMLRQIAGLLQAQADKDCAIARIGSDNFGILLEGRSMEEGYRLVDDWRKALSAFRFNWEGKTIPVSTSTGLVPVTAAWHNVEELMQAAYQACYFAKEKGPNRVHVYRPDDADVLRYRVNADWVPRIRSALHDNRLQLVAQPITPVNGAAHGLHYELLIRMVDEKGVLSDNAGFLSAAEQYKFSPQIDRWAVETAFGWLEQNPQHVERLFLCSVNLSGLSLDNEEFLDFLVQRCHKTKVPLDRFGFEVTETSAIANLARAAQVMGKLREMGCHLALDDFGSGLSSFTYLKALPVDYVKIDGSFVRRVASDPLDLAILHSVRNICRMLGKKTVAEFVENQEILDKLREVGIDYAQGHHIGRPQLLTSLI